MGYTTFSPVFSLTAHFLPQFAGTRCHVFISIFRDSKTDFPRDGKAMRWEVWGIIKLTAKPASVLANKPQLREKQVYDLTYSR